MEIQKNMIGSFYAITFNNDKIDFIVYDDDSMDCPSLGISSIQCIYIKPRLELWTDEKTYVLGEPSKYVKPKKEDLIENYVIDDELLVYLKNHGMARYSSDMAHFYNLCIKEGFDFKHGVHSPFKWARKRGPIMLKQRNGEFQ